jgi:proline dehydrogenase
MMRRLLLAGSQSAWLRRQAMRRGFVRRAVSRFMPGETLDDALRAAGELKTHRLGVVLTHLGENVTIGAEADQVVRHYVEVLDRLPASGLDAEVSVKLTQLGLDLSPDVALGHTLQLAELSAAQGRRLWIDMESSPYVDRTLELYRRVHERQPLVGVCVQAYLHRTAADVETLVRIGAAVRVVKGAYQETPEVAMPRKADVDASFERLCERLLADDARRAGCWLTIGTHDRARIARLAEWAERHGVRKDGYEFALLYGIQRAEQHRLAASGQRVRVLISYGQSWFPWYMRRLAERPANVLFVLRSLIGG